MGNVFLIKKKFVEGNIDEILSPIDELVLSYLVENKTSTSYNDIKKYIIIRSESTCFQDRMNQLAFKNICSLSSKYDLDLMAISFFSIPHPPAPPYTYSPAWYVPVPPPAQ